MHLNRVSSGLNWNPHFIPCAGFVDVSSEDVEPLDGAASVYPISVGTLSDVIPIRHQPLLHTLGEGGAPFPPGQVLIMSISSGVALYTAATPALDQILVCV
jgi:hypothetical protein